MRYLLPLLPALASICLPPPLVNATQAPRCAYADQTPAARLLLQQLDATYLRCVRRACTGPRRNYAAFFELDSCFVPRSVAFSFGGPARGLSARMSRGLTRRYAKHILDYGSIQVLEYSHVAGAVAAQAVMDSVVRSCRGRSTHTDERCVGTDVYSVARRGSFLVRFNMWQEDPLLRSAANQVKAQLLGAVQP